MKATGDYTISFYNRYGAKIKGAEKYSKCVTEATIKGEKKIKKDAKKNENGMIRAASFSIDRRIFNSLDRRAL